MIDIPDLIISGLYIAAIFAIGLWSGIRHQRKTRDNKNVAG